MLTSSNEARDLITGYKLGVNRYLRKPLGFVIFSQAIAKLGVHWLAINKNPYDKNPHD